MKGHSEFIAAESGVEFPAMFESPEAASSDVDISQWLLRAKWYLAAGLMGGLLVGWVGYRQLGPVFNVSTKVLISQKPTIQIREGQTTGSANQGEHVALIMSPLIVGKAVETHKLNELPSLSGSDDPADEILSDLKVKRSAGQDRSVLNVLDITYRNRNEKDALAIVEAVVDAYRDYLAENYERREREMIQRITDASEDLFRRLRQRERDYLAFRDDAPLHWRNAPGADGFPGDVTNVHQERILAIEGQRRTNLIRQTETKARLRALEAAIVNDESRESVEVLVRRLLSLEAGSAATTPQIAVQAQSGAAASDTQLLPLLLEESRLLRNFGPEHPDVITVRRNIQTIREFYRQRGVQLPEDTSLDENGEDARRSTDLVAVYLESLRQQLQELKHSDTELGELFDREARQAKQVGRYQARDQELTDEIRGMRTLSQLVVNRLNQVNLVKDNGGYSLQSIAPARAELDVKRLLKFLGGGGVAGLALMLAMTYLRESNDTTIRTPDDIVNRLHLPVIGTIAEFDPHRSDAAHYSQLDGTLCYAHRPESDEAEAFRSIRTALWARIEDEQARVIQFTSPNSGEGTTMCVSNLAAALAEAELNVLLIDANLRQPRLHRLFGAAHNVGLTDVLSGEIELQNAVQTTAVRGLRLLTAGGLATNPAELLSSPRFRQLLKDVKAEFDVVLLDSSPLLTVSDACVVASKTDGIVLVLRMSQSDRVSAEQAQERLETHGAALWGVVANSHSGTTIPRSNGGVREQETDAVPKPEPAVLGSREPSDSTTAHLPA